MNGRNIKSLLSRARQSAVFAGVFGTGIRFGANLFLLPIVLLKLSSSELAVWWVFVALGNFGNLADFGFGSTVPRIYNYLLAGAEDFEAEGLRESKPDGPPNYEGIRRVNAAVQSLYFKISLAAITLLAIGGTIFLLKPVAESGISQRVWIYWALFIVAIGYNLATFHWALAIQGLNRMRDLQLIYVWGGLSYASCAAVLLFCKAGLLSMVIATFLKGFVMHGLCERMYRKMIPQSGQRLPVEPHIIRKLWPNACKFGIIALGAYFVANGNILICSQLLGKDLTASFGLTVQVGTYLSGFASLWLIVKWPEISMLRTQGRLNEMAVLFARRLTMVTLTYVGMALVVLVAGNPLLAWKGSHTRLIDTPYLIFYFIYGTHQIFYAQFGMLAFTENVVPFFKTTLFTGIAALAGGLFLAWLFGIWGLLAAPLLAEISYNSWFTVRRGFQGQPLSVGQFCRAALFAES